MVLFIHPSFSHGAERRVDRWDMLYDSTLSSLPICILNLFWEYFRTIKPGKNGFKGTINYHLLLSRQAITYIEIISSLYQTTKQKPAIVRFLLLLDPLLPGSTVFLKLYVLKLILRIVTAFQPTLYLSTVKVKDGKIIGKKMQFV